MKTQRSRFHSKRPGVSGILTALILSLTVPESMRGQDPGLLLGQQQEPACVRLSREEKAPRLSCLDLEKGVTKRVGRLPAGTPRRLPALFMSAVPGGGETSVLASSCAVPAGRTAAGGVLPVAFHRPGPGNEVKAFLEDLRRQTEAQVQALREGDPEAFGDEGSPEWEALCEEARGVLASHLALPSLASAWADHDIIPFLLALSGVVGAPEGVDLLEPGPTDGGSGAGAVWVVLHGPPGSSPLVFLMRTVRAPGLRTPALNGPPEYLGRDWLRLGWTRIPRSPSAVPDRGEPDPGRLLARVEWRQDSQSLDLLAGDRLLLRAGLGPGPAGDRSLHIETDGLSAWFEETVEGFFWTVEEEGRGARYRLLLFVPRDLPLDALVPLLGWLEESGHGWEPHLAVLTEDGLPGRIELPRLAGEGMPVEERLALLQVRIGELRHGAGPLRIGSFFLPLTPGLAVEEGSFPLGRLGGLVARAQGNQGVVLEMPAAATTGDLAWILGRIREGSCRPVYLDTPAATGGG